MSVTRAYLYSRFGRFWHWSQAALILALLLTGFEIHGSYVLFGFERAVALHNLCAWTWLGLYAFIVFWHLTTGEWKHYAPTTRQLAAVARHYAYGMFKGEPHPVKKRPEARINPLQRLVYLSISILIIPVQMLTGILYYLYNDWAAWGFAAPLAAVSLPHVLGGFVFASFLIVHVYMTTTGHTPLAHLKAMCTGWEDVEEDDQPAPAAPAAAGRGATTIR